MRYLVLACDYDGTLAAAGRMDPATIEALRQLRATGRRVVLLTGRELPDLLALLPEPQLFDRIVAENGALLYRPVEREERLLAEPAPEPFVAELRRRNVAPLSVGRVIVATWEPEEKVVLDVIREQGLERQLIFNKGAVMVLPSGVNKATGLDAALDELGLSPHNCVAIGDAENDHALLARAECAVAVANALPALKEAADLVTRGADGDGARELVAKIAASDLAELGDRLSRHAIPIGTRDDGAPVAWPAYGANLLVAGASGSGKSTFATGLLERLGQKGYQCCIVDPEGDYATLPGVVVLGDTEHAPTLPQMADVLAPPGRSVVLNLLAISLEHRPEFFASALARLRELRDRCGRPHWIVADEAHHLMPPGWSGAPSSPPGAMHGTLLITVYPDRVAAPVLATVDGVVAVGDAPDRVLRNVADAMGREVPAFAPASLGPNEALFWRPASGAPPIRIRTEPARGERRRHLRKYAEGELPEARSFYFRGPRNALNLRAQNLVLFLQLAAGVDDDTWMHHLRLGDYSRWFREAIKDDDLAADVAVLERQGGLTADESRVRVRAAIEARYAV